MGLANNTRFTEFAFSSKRYITNLHNLMNHSWLPKPGVPQMIFRRASGNSSSVCRIRWSLNKIWKHIKTIFKLALKHNFVGSLTFNKTNISMELKKYVIITCKPINTQQIFRYSRNMQKMLYRKSIMGIKINISGRANKCNRELWATTYNNFFRTYEGIVVERLLLWAVRWWEAPLSGYRRGSCRVLGVPRIEGSSSLRDVEKWAVLAVTWEGVEESNLCQQWRVVCPYFPQIWHCTRDKDKLDGILVKFLDVEKRGLE